MFGRCTQCDRYEGPDCLAEDVHAVNVADRQKYKLAIKDITSLFVRAVRVHDETFALDAAVRVQAVFPGGGMNQIYGRKNVMHVNHIDLYTCFAHVAPLLECGVDDMEVMDKPGKMGVSVTVAAVV